MELRPYTLTKETEIRRIDAEVKKLQLIVYNGNYQGEGKGANSIGKENN